MGIHPVLRTLDGSNTHLQNKIPQWPAVVVMAVFYVLMAGHHVRLAPCQLAVAGVWPARSTYPLYLIHEFIGWAIMKSLDHEVPRTGALRRHARTDGVVGVADQPLHRAANWRQG